jgi:predicted HTH domain antitoxin
MRTVSACLSEETASELEAYLDAEQLDRNTAVQRLLAGGLEQWREEQALERLDAGEVSFTRAAEIADLSPWEFARLAKERDVTWVGGDHLDDDLDALSTTIK